MKRWYTLYTKADAEHKVATTLRRRGLEVYLPEIKDPKLAREGKGKPFFPCYLFLKVDFEIVGLSHVQWTPGLRRVLAFADRPVPVSNEVIDLIRRKLGDFKADGDRPVRTFEPGDTVRITAGPLRDMLAIFEKPTTSSQRVLVLLNILGHASRVQVDTADLEKAAPLSTGGLGPKRLRRTRGRGRHIKRAAGQV